MRILVQMLVALAVVVYTALPMPVSASLHHPAMQTAPQQDHAGQEHAGMSMTSDSAMAQHHHAPKGGDAAPKAKVADLMHCVICLCAASSVPSLAHGMFLRSAPLPSLQRSLIAIAPAPQVPPPRS